MLGARSMLVCTAFVPRYTVSSPDHVPDSSINAARPGIHELGTRQSPTAFVQRRRASVAHAAHTGLCRSDPQNEAQGRHQDFRISWYGTATH
jgi:hypothetical protein